MNKKYMEDADKLMKENKGKPMATVYYLKNGYEMGAVTMMRGFLFNFLSLLAACLILANSFAAMNSFFGRWWLVFLIGMLVSASSHLTTPQLKNESMTISSV